MLELRRVSFRYGSGFELAELTFKTPARASVGIIGPSGSGKSTVLQLLGGHLFPDQGTIFLDDQPITQLPPSRRAVSTIFQELALFPHLSVHDNIAFPLRARGTAARERQRLVDFFLQRFGLWHRRAAVPSQLSGGERQRTALARSLAADPSLLLMDEPTSSLDADQKAAVLACLEDLLGSPRPPTLVVVTHDYEFAFSACQYLVILKEGRLVAQGERDSVLARPPNAETASILGLHAIVPGVAADHDFVSTDRVLRCRLPQQYAHLNGGGCALLVRSDAVKLGSPPADRPTLTGRGVVRRLQNRGNYVRITVGSGQHTILCDVWAQNEQRVPSLGGDVPFWIGVGDAHFVADDPLAQQRTAS